LADLAQERTKSCTWTPHCWSFRLRTRRLTLRWHLLFLYRGQLGAEFHPQADVSVPKAGWRFEILPRDVCHRPARRQRIMSRESSEHWFPAKRRGGSGSARLNTSRMFLAFWCTIVIAASPCFVMQRSAGPFIAFAVFMFAVLVLVCLVKGEPPPRRW
jgi:hypothetical protein